MKSENIIHSQTLGEGSQTVILVHGLPSSLEEWKPMAQKLAASGYRTIALDLPGHGASYQPAEIGAYSTDRFYADFEAWLEQLPIDPPPVLLGHSFGGHLCLRYALEHPQKVSGLVLIDPFLASAQLAGVNRLLIYTPPIFAYFLRTAPFRLVKSLLWAGSLVKRGSRLVSFLSPGELHQVALDFKRCSPQIVRLPGTVRDLTSEAAGLKIPTLLLWGSRDPTLSVSWFPELAASLPNSTHHVLNARHSPHLSNFDEVFPIILNFLASQ